MMYEKIKVAVADNDSAARQMLSAYLSKDTDYDAVLFESGHELLEYLEHDRAEIIVLDLEMEGLDGIATFDKLKRRSDTADIPVMFLTGKGDRETVLKCIDRGADSFMVKPISREGFITKLNDIMSKIDEFKADKTILMVDDDEQFLKIGKVKLSRYYNVVTKSSGRAALDYLETHQADLIILDYFMPLYDGGKVLAILKHREKTKNIPVIMLSSVPEEEIMSVCRNNPPEGVAVKNGHLEELLVIIKGLLK
jgi:CheY-like chemotaxis protein